MPVVFEVVEECLDQRHVDLLEAQPLESDGSVVATKPQQQRECVAVGPDGVGAQVALHGEVVCQEGRHVHGEIGRLHDGFLRGNDVGERLVDALHDFRKQLGRQMQVVLGSGNRPVAQVGCEHRQLRTQIRALAVPAKHGVDGERVPQIVDPRSLASAAMLNAASKQELAEQRIDHSLAPRATAIRGEEECVGRAPAEGRVVRLQTPDERQGGRHMAVLAELAVAHGQDAAVQVGVGDS